MDENRSPTNTNSAVNWQGPIPEGSFAAPSGDKSVVVPLVSPQAYQNPVGNQAGPWSAGMQNMLGATTGAAPQMSAVNAGKAATYSGAQMDKGQYQQTWNQQQALAQQLGAMAMGYGPSMAQVQAQQAQQQSLQNQMAMLGSQRGGANPAMAAYQAQQLGAQSMQQAAQQAVAGRTQEEMAALQAQGGLYGAMNQQAQQFAGNQAQLYQQAQLASMGAINQQNSLQAQLYQQANQSNLQAQQQQSALNAQQYDNYMSMLQQMNLAQYQANMAREAQQSSNYLTAAGIQKDLSINQANLNANIAGSVAGGAAGVAGIVGAAAASDINSKKNIVSGKQQLEKLLKNIYDSPEFLKLSVII